MTAGRSIRLSRGFTHFEEVFIFLILLSYLVLFDLSDPTDYLNHIIYIILFLRMCTCRGSLWRVSLCRLGYMGTHSIDKDGADLIEILIPLSVKCWD